MVSVFFIILSSRLPRLPKIQPMLSWGIFTDSEMVLLQLLSDRSLLSLSGSLLIIVNFSSEEEVVLPHEMEDDLSSELTLLLLGELGVASLSLLVFSRLIESTGSIKEQTCFIASVMLSTCLKSCIPSREYGADPL